VATIPGHGDRFLNMVHRDDVVGAIIAALHHGQPGEIYNVADDEPVTQSDFFRWLSEALGLPMPPFADAPAAGKRGDSNKKILNRKLKSELRFLFRFPTFRQGYTAEIQRLQERGLQGVACCPP
jgi:nucleoside-diphosphate-sugar epimerase